MKAEELQQRIARCRERYVEAQRALSNELNQVVPRVATREVDNLRQAETEALKVLVLAELYASFAGDPDATAAWLYEVVETGEIAVKPAEEW